MKTVFALFLSLGVMGMAHAAPLASDAGLDAAMVAGNVEGTKGARFGGHLVEVVQCHEPQTPATPEPASMALLGLGLAAAALRRRK